MVTNSPTSAVELFLSKEIVEEVCKCTKERRVATSTGKQGKNVSKKELVAYFGLVLLVGCERQWDVVSL